MGAADSVLFAGELEKADVPVPQTPDGESWPDLKRDPVVTVPESPVTIINEGTLRGVRVAVLAITPIYAHAGETRFATRLNVSLQGMRLVENPLDLLGAYGQDSKSSSTPTPTSSIFASPQASDVACNDASYQPVNQQLKDGQAKWRIRVSRAGMQQVTAASLTAAGFTAIPTAFSSLRIRFNGVSIAIRPIDTNGNGNLDAGEAIRFYASDPGDRWNRTATYWLSVGDSSPDARPIMPVRSAPAANGGASVIGLQRGIYTNDKIYDSTMPGVDGDHWFGADLKAANGAADTWSIYTTSHSAFSRRIGGAGKPGRQNQHHAQRVTWQRQRNSQHGRRWHWRVNGHIQPAWRL